MPSPFAATFLTGRGQIELRDPELAADR